jgi:WD40 repeat protein
MHKTLMVLLILFSTLHAKDITPIATIKVSGLVSDFVKDGDYLYVATDAGSVDIIDLFTRKIIRQIHLEPLKNAMGDLVPVRIHSIDRFQNKTLLVTSGISAYRNIWIDDGKTLKKIIDEEKHLMPKRAFFTDKGEVVLGTFGSDVILYNNEEKYKLYDSHISESTMGGMVLSQDKKKMVFSDESGTVRLIDVKSAKVEKTFSSEHVDNIYSVAYSKGLILTAGQDRRVGVYQENKSAYHIKSDFLVYCVGLSPSAQTGIYSSGENHDLQLFHTKDGRKTDRLVGHYATPTKIMFIYENALISAGDEETIFFWKIDK